MSTLTPGTLRHEDVCTIERCGVKLHELHVLEGHPCPICHGVARPGYNQGVSCGPVDLSGPAGGKDHGIRSHGNDLPRL